MAVFIPLEEMEKAHAAYNECSEQLTNALNEAKTHPQQGSAQFDKVGALSKQCDELLEVYLDAFKKYYRKEEKL